MELKCVVVGPVETCCYLLWQEERDDCLVIDPGDSAETIRAAAGNRRISDILLTHGHFDHIGAVSALLTPETGLWIHSLDAPMLNDPWLNGGELLLGQRITAPAATGLLAEAERLTLAGLAVRVLHTPGHTPGSCCFEIENKLFTGDTLFHQGVGRTDLPGGSAVQLRQSLKRLMKELNGRPMEIYPGH